MPATGILSDISTQLTEAPIPAFLPVVGARDVGDVVARRPGDATTASSERDARCAPGGLHLSCKISVHVLKNNRIEGICIA